MQIPLALKLGAYALIALVSAGFAFIYYDDVTTAQYTVRKIVYNPDAEKALSIGTDLNADNIGDLFKSVTLPESIAEDQLDWAMNYSETLLRSLRGLTLTTTLQPGDFLRAEDFVAQSDDILASKVEPGARAFSISVRPGSAVETFLAPGARVDVIHTIINDDKSVSSDVLLEDVSLLAVGPYISETAYVEAGRPTYTSLTVQASPERIAKYLERTEASRGQVTVVLLNPCDGDQGCRPVQRWEVAGQ